MAENREIEISNIDQSASEVFRTAIIEIEDQQRRRKEVHLLDPDESVVKIQDERGYADLLEKVLDRKQKFAEFLREQGAPPDESVETDGDLLETGLEVIVGDPETPERCSRQALLFMHKTSAGSYLMYLRSNLEHDKLANYYAGSNANVVDGGSVIMPSEEQPPIKHARMPKGSRIYFKDWETIAIEPGKNSVYLIQENT